MHGVDPSPAPAPTPATTSAVLFNTLFNILVSVIQPRLGAGQPPVLNKRDKPVDDAGRADAVTDTRGIVHPRSGFDHFVLRRSAPGEVLAPYVERLWCVSWDLPPGEVFEQPILAHPAVNVVLQPGRAAVYGPATRLSKQSLRGCGWAVAAMFRPGGAQPFVGSARHWLDRAEPVAQHWADGAALVTDVEGVPGRPAEAEPARADRLRSFLAERAPTVVPAETALVTSAAALIATDRGLCRVEDLSARIGIGTRSLQRLFAEHVGLSPKQVIRRYRLLEAAEAVSTGGQVSWSELAAELGFSDQAHLTRDFTAAFGVPPARYAGATGYRTSPE